jgi:chloride channel 3/4/5
LRSLKGVRGWIANNWDASQAWILVTIIGVCAGCVAAGIDVSQEYLSDLKTGYCSTNIFYNNKFCCWYEDPDAQCYQWKPWSSLFTYDPTSYASSYIDFFSYCSWGLLFATLSAVLIYVTGEPYPSSKKRKIGPIKYYAAGSGVPEVKTILGGFVIRGFLGIQTLWVKAVGLALVTSSGMNLGKEGPLVHIACCLGNVLCRLFKKYNTNEAKRREILSASAAAGVSVAFGAPIGGVLFSLEEVSYYFPSKTMWRSFFCALVGSMTLKLINPFRTGKTVLFEVTFNKDWHDFEMFNFLILGIFGGLIGAAFCKLNLMWNRMRRTTWLNKYPVQEVVCVALISVVWNYFNPYTKMGGPELVAELLSECTGQNNRGDGLCSHELVKYNEVVKLLALAIIQKFILTVITFGLKVPCGVFIPSLAMGSLFGRIVGLTAQYYQQTYPTSSLYASCGEPGVNCFTPGVYAMVGAAATLAGITRMTLSLVVIVFELTGSLGYALPLMLGVLVAKWVADAFEPTSIYENLIELNDYPFLDNKREYLHTKNVVDVLESNLEIICINEENTISTVKEKINRQADYGYADGGFPIIDGKHLVGYIAVNDIEYVLDECPLPGNSQCLLRRNKPVSEQNPEPTSFERDSPVPDYIVNDSMLDLTPFMDQAPLSVPLNASMEVVLELFIKLGVRYLCVVDNGHYVGVIHKKRLLAYLHEFEH